MVCGKEEDSSLLHRRDRICSGLQSKTQSEGSTLTALSSFIASWDCLPILIPHTATAAIPHRVMSFLCSLLLLILLAQDRILKGHSLITRPYRSTLFHSISEDGHNRSTIRIGAPLSYSPGDIYFSKGTLISNSWDMFVDWVNIERGGVRLNGTNVSMSIQIVEDYSSVEDVTAVTRYLLDEEQVDFMFAPYTSGLTNASATITEKEQFLLISAISHPYYPNLNYTIFTLPSDLSRMRSTFRSFASFGAKNISVITESDHDNCLYENSVKAAHAEGISLSSHHTLDKKSPTYLQDITDILLELKEKHVDVVVGCSIASLCTHIPTISRDIDYNADGIGFIVCFSDPAIQSSMGELVDYLFDITPWAPLESIHCNITGWTAAEFDARYFEYFSLRPNYHAASAFADCLILLAAIEETQSLDHEVLLDSIRSNTYKTMYATLSFSDGPQASFDALTQQMRYNYVDKTFNLLVVSPPSEAQGSVLYPMPTWKAKQCMADTLYCSGHGTCSAEGICICDPNYYGKEFPDSCDAYCSGETKSGFCLEVQQYYIGGLVPYNSPVYLEFVAMMHLAVELINNKTDGWYDQDVNQVIFMLQVNDSNCDPAIAYNAVLDQTNWAKSQNDGKYLDGLIGDLCSEASASVASYGKSVSLPQVSYASTASSLSNVDLYPYFARVCSSDEIQSKSLVSLLEYIGLTPFIAVLYRSDLDYSKTLASNFLNRWRSLGYIVLLEVGFSADFTDYHNLVFQLAATGAQSILLVLENPEIQLLWNATEELQLLHEDIVWIAVESWATVKFQPTDLKRNGVIGLSFYESNEPTMVKFLDLWKSLDPTIYPDADGDRESIEIYSGYIVDSVVSLALAYQEAIEQQSNIRGEELFRQYVYGILCDAIAFEGVSGHKEFTLYGDQVDNKFSIRSYYYYPSGSSSSTSRSRSHSSTNNIISGTESESISGGEAEGEGEEEDSMVSEWVNIGFLNETLILLDMKDIMWPDGSSGETSKYSSQLIPYCPPGMEPLVSSSGISYCSSCAVGYYKPDYGSTLCQKCPTGGNCNNVGVVIPCVLPGYWRMNPPTPEELSNFAKYKIYQCDNEDSCLGGCDLNVSCSSDRVQSSPTCGVCLEDYYLSNGYCTKCSQTTSYAPILIYFFQLFGVCVILYFVLNSKVKFDSQALLVEELNSRLKRDISSSSPSQLADDGVESGSFAFPSSADTSTHGAAAVAAVKSESISPIHPPAPLPSAGPLSDLNLARSDRSEVGKSGSPLPVSSDRDTITTGNNNRSSMSDRVRSLSESFSSSRVYRFTSYAVFNTFIFVRSLLPRTAVTFKLMISFWQVMTSGFFSLQISWPPNMKRFLNSIISLNPFDAIFESSSCVKHDMLTSYLILVIVFCLPFIFLLCLLLVVGVLYRVKVQRYCDVLLEEFGEPRGVDLSRRWVRSCNKKIWASSTTMLVWFSLIIFAIGSATMIEFLNCRDLGSAGIYLRSDYSVDCESSSYQSFKTIAVFGVLMFPIGIPLLFFNLIRYRRHPLVVDCAKLLYGNFDKSWKYFEVYDLIRKLLLTSILLFIGTPDSPSRCLYLLIVDLISLNIISYCQPYFYFYDNFLATTFIVIEIMAFMIGLVITSEIYKSEHYNYSAMFTTLIIMILTSVVLITPATFLLKLNIIKQEYVNYILNNTVSRSSFVSSSRVETNPVISCEALPSPAASASMGGSDDDEEEEDGDGNGDGGSRNALRHSRSSAGGERVTTCISPHEVIEPKDTPDAATIANRLSWRWLPQRSNNSSANSRCTTTTTTTGVREIEISEGQKEQK